MKLKVDNNKKLEILESEILLTGNVNSYILELDIDSSYEDFTITVVFKNNKKIIKKVITYETQKIEIPHEILEESGDLYIGLFAEKLEDDTLIQRNSVNLVTLYVEEGSYTDDGDYSEPIETTILEQYLQQMLDFYNNSKTTFDENAQNKTQLYNENAATKTQEFTDVADKAASDINNVVEKLEEDVASHVYDGATFIPNVDTEGNISWTNDKDLPNPETKNIKGDTGLTPDISVGSTTTLSPGTNAYVEILGTKENPIINFYIPRGDNGRIEFRLVNELPVVGETGIIYLVPEEDPEVQNRYDEYIWINNGWEKFGSASIDIDLDKYYTKEEIATILLDYVTNSSLTQTLSSYVTNQGLTTTLLDYVTKTDLSTELTDYVKFTDYATSTTGGVFKTGFNATVNANGNIQCSVTSYPNYVSNMSTNAFISKGTLENVITGKELVNKTYVDTIVGDIGTILDNINGESVGA